MLCLDRIGTVVDLDRSNGLPDLVSTLAIGLGAVGAGFLAHQEQGGWQVAAGILAVLLALATLAGWLLASGDATEAFTAAVAVLIIACPCASDWRRRPPSWSAPGAVRSSAS